MDISFQITMNEGQDVSTATATITTDTKTVTPKIDVAAGATVNYLITLDPDAVAAYCVIPTFNGTLTTTNGAGAPDVITLVANQPVAWHNKMGLAKHFANANVWSNWAFHNTDAGAGTVSIFTGQDT